MPPRRSRQVPGASAASTLPTIAGHHRRSTEIYSFAERSGALKDLQPSKSGDSITPDFCAETSVQLFKLFDFINTTDQLIQVLPALAVTFRRMLRTRNIYLWGSKLPIAPLNLYTKRIPVQ